ncbi:MAG: arrestin C-terminal domain-containing protein [Candidatus Altiarchaeia archaeon]
MKNSKKWPVLGLIALTLIACSVPALAEDISFNVSMSKKSYAPGEELVLNYEVNNPTDKNVTYKCMVTYDPPTSKTPGCILKEVTLEPGQRFTGSIVSTAEFAVETGAQVKLIDVNDNVLSIQNIPIIRVNEEIKAECGNGLCDGGENYQSCPLDCISGGADGSCDAVKDAVCDPDCGRTDDADCVCNNDRNCEKGIESYMNCPLDCPSGSSDAYCDGLSDGVCDPDCAKEQDKDCSAGDMSSYLPYLGIGLVLVAAMVFLGYKKAQSRKIEEEKEEFLKWKQERGGQ